VDSHHLKNLKRNRVSLVIVLFLVSILSLAFAPRPVIATNNAIISAPNVVDTHILPSNVTTFAINVANVGPSPETLHAWQLNLYLNPGILKITQVIEGPALSDIANALGGSTLFTGKFNATTGLVQSDDLIVVSNYPDAGFVGNGTILYVKVQVLALGTTSLVMNNTSLISIAGSTATEIQHTVINGLFSNIPFNIAPTASFTVSPMPTMGNPVQFDASASYDPDGSIAKYSWDFGDGNHTSVSLPMIDHTYQTVGGPLTVVLTITDNGGANASAQKSIFVAAVNSRPIAVFTFTPINPMVHQTVTFNATGSYDPDGDFIFAYYWDFGDGFSAVNGAPTVQHMYNLPGDFNVTLTVSDSFMLRTSVSKSISITQPSLHDVGVIFVQAYPTTALSGQPVNINVRLVNQGTFNETVDLTVYYDSHVAVTIHGINIPVIQYPYYVNAVWDTSGVIPGNYTLSATVFLSTDQNPSNNHLTGGQVTILPPPVLVVTPSSGPIGTMVLVHGSGFSIPTNPPQPEYPITVELSFDDQFVGFITSTNGTFNFVFNIPLSQPGHHLIHALAGFFPSPIEASANFTVTPQPSSSSSLTLMISVGSIYFPGDKATVFVLSSLNGSPTQMQTIQLKLLVPNGTSTSLTLTSVSPGLYKASYNVPTTGSTGTYALIATAKINGVNATSLGNFEVKPTWLQANSHAITATSIAGAIGAVSIVGFAWRKGYLSKRKDEFPIP